jgi:hypothetical protein
VLSVGFATALRGFIYDEKLVDSDAALVWLFLLATPDRGYSDQPDPYLSGRHGSKPQFARRTPHNTTPCIEC